MSRFTEKASTKIQFLSDEDIIRLIQNQEKEISLRNTVLDNAEVGYLLVNKNGKILYYSSFVKRILELNWISKGEHLTLGKMFTDKDAYDFVSDCLSKHLNGKEFFLKQRNRYLGEIVIRILSKTIPNSSEMIFEFMDFTFLNKIKEEFQKNESLAAMTSMAAGVAHEIKNPLASISIYLQLLKRKLDSEGIVKREDAEKCLDVINEEIERLNKIAVDFLFAVKPMKVDFAITDINEIIRKTCRVAMAEVENNGIQLVIDLATSLPKLRIDSNLIEQSLLNLIRNSVQAFKKTNNAVISVNSFIDGNNVKVSVSDNGCGISEEHMEKIFEPYYTTKDNGTGLGLTTIFKIMKQHNGSVTAQSKENEGSVFTLTFPIPDSERFKIAR